MRIISKSYLNIIISVNLQILERGEGKGREGEIEGRVEDGKGERRGGEGRGGEKGKDREGEER